MGDSSSLRLTNYNMALARLIAGFLFGLPALAFAALCTWSMITSQFEGPLSIAVAVALLLGAVFVWMALTVTLWIELGDQLVVFSLRGRKRFPASEIKRLNIAYERASADTNATYRVLNVVLAGGKWFTVKLDNDEVARVGDYASARKIELT